MAQVMDLHGVWLIATATLSAALVLVAVVGRTTLRPTDGARHQKSRSVGGLVFSIGSVLVATLVPVTRRGDSNLLLNPTDGIDGLDVLGNLMLFVPFGAFLHLMGASKRITILVAAAFSIIIEILQFFLIQGRSTATSDLILNVVGAFVGHGLIRHAHSTSGN
jgi:glycopeptide antibiotics resistance protein